MIRAGPNNGAVFLVDGLVSELCVAFDADVDLPQTSECGELWARQVMETWLEVGW